jgi:CelD/BcsL family acetyltransferase involved in cellulose biosynthesis
MRVFTDGPDLDRELDRVFALEASGWKGRAGTAILSSPRTERVYRSFAHGAARQGWLRLYLLELDGLLVAADYGCAFNHTGYLMKTAYSERHARCSPGLILRAAVLRASIEEDLRAYDFLGNADPYKTRWTAGTRSRTTIWAYRGPEVGAYLYRTRLRPLLKASRDRARQLRNRDRGGTAAAR